MRRRSTAIALAVALALVLGACGSDRPTRVYVIGDSLVTQASRSLKRLLTKEHFRSQISSLPGTATCDWFANAQGALETFDPDVVVMSFSGNAIGPCMRGPGGVALDDAQYKAKYRRDTLRMLDLFGSHRHVYLVGAPVSGSGDDRVYRIYEQLARERDNVTFVDGGEYITPDHRYVRMLPCLRDEPCTGPVVNGVRNNIVRAPDRAHFCPVAQRDPGAPCPAWSSGAYRFALAIAQAVEKGER